MNRIHRSSSGFVEPPAALETIDFLSIPAGSSSCARSWPASENVGREGCTFFSSVAWSAVCISGLSLKAGWWRLEADADWIDAAHGPEVTLHFAEAEPVMTRARPTGPLMRLSGGLCSVSLMPSPDPGQHAFRILRLRRISSAELAGFVRKRLAALAHDRRPISRLASAIRQVASGRNFSAQAPAAIAVDTRATVPGSAAEPELVREIIDNIEVVRRAAEVLAPQAMHIVKAEFATNGHLQAIYCDVREAGFIAPKPQWDSERARWFDFVQTPVFFRASSASGSGAPWARLQEMVRTSGEVSVRRIALPLATRAEVVERSRPAQPALPILPVWPRVSVIIPTKTRTDLLQKCLIGLGALTSYPDIEVVVVDNGSRDSGFWAGAYQSHKALNLKRVTDVADFNFSRLINFGVRQATGEILLLLNDDVEPIEAGWLHRMVASAVEPGVGAVGARLVYPNGDIQHAGVVLGIGGTCGHLWRNLPRDEALKNPHIVLPGRRMAVTGACLAVRRSVFENAGGLDEDAFAVTLNDIDFCLRLREAGLHTVYRGDAVLKHDESRSRGGDGRGKKRLRRQSEIATFRKRWERLLADDPYASPAFDPSTESGATRI